MSDDATDPPEPTLSVPLLSTDRLTLEPGGESVRIEPRISIRMNGNPCAEVSLLEPRFDGVMLTMPRTEIQVQLAEGQEFAQGSLVTLRDNGRLQLFDPQQAARYQTPIGYVTNLPSLAGIANVTLVGSEEPELTPRQIQPILPQGPSEWAEDQEFLSEQMLNAMGVSAEFLEGGLQSSAARDTLSMYTQRVRDIRNGVSENAAFHMWLPCTTDPRPFRNGELALRTDGYTDMLYIHVGGGWSEATDDHVDTAKVLWRKRMSDLSSCHPDVLEQQVRAGLVTKKDLYSLALSLNTLGSGKTGTTSAMAIRMMKLAQELDVQPTPDPVDVKDEEDRLRDDWAASPWAEFFEAEQPSTETIPVGVLRNLLQDEDATRTFVELVTEYANRLAQASVFLQTGRVRAVAPLSGLALAPSQTALPEVAVLLHAETEAGVRRWLPFRENDVYLVDHAGCTVTRDFMPSGLYFLRCLKMTVQPPLISTLEDYSRSWLGSPCHKAGLKDPHEPLLALLTNSNLAHLKPRRLTIAYGKFARLGQYMMVIDFGDGEP